MHAPKRPTFEEFEVYYDPPNAWWAIWRAQNWTMVTDNPRDLGDMIEEAIDLYHSGWVDAPSMDLNEWTGV